MAAARRLGGVASHLSAAAPLEEEVEQTPHGDEFSLGVWGADELTLYDYSYDREAEVAEATLIAKRCVVEADPPGSTPETATRLPVYTLTFAHPQSIGQADDAPLEVGDVFDSVSVERGGKLPDAWIPAVMKMVIPGYKAKSFSVSAERPGEFDLTVKIYPNGRASGYLNRLEIGDTIGFWPKERKSRNPGTHVARALSR